MKTFLVAATVAAVSLVASQAFAATNLVLNGSFSQTSLPANYFTTGGGKGFDGVEDDTLGGYTNVVSNWTTVNTSGNAYNIYINDPTKSVATTTSANTRYTSGEPQHLNTNYTGASPDGGAFMILDGDPGDTGALQQTVSGLTVGQKYNLSFYWAGAELSDRTGYSTIQLTGSLGSSNFATPIYSNTAASNQPGSFSGWQLVNLVFTASSQSELLSFLAVGTPAANLPPVALLDGVSLTVVPEPATWALMITGIGLIGASVRRRRFAAAA